MPELSLIIPTYNERENLQPLLEALAKALTFIDYEVIFVDDDSSDHTAAAARAIAQRNSRVRVLQRIGRRGLASAVVEGMLAASAPLLLVMDADLQHDERIIPAMVEKLQAEDLDVVVATRNSDGGSMGEFAAERVGLSKVGRVLSALVSKVPVTDPMSGFFLVRSQFFHGVAHQLSCVGFKILLDLLSTARGPVRVGEVGYRFRNRVQGQSKLDILVGLEYVELLLHKLSRGTIPVSYLLFGLTGSVGVLVNFLLAALFGYWLRLDFRTSQLAGALITIAVNFLLNNTLTFRSARLRGVNLLAGLVVFYFCCSIGLFAQVTVATSLHASGMNWFAATLAGIALGSVWNYSTAYLFVWQVQRRRTERLGEAYSEAVRLKSSASR